jgi:hypothetical protein
MFWVCLTMIASRVVLRLIDDSGDEEQSVKLTDDG